MPGTGLRVRQRHQTHVGQLALARIDQLHRNDVVTPSEAAEHGLPAFGKEVGDQKEHRPPAEQRLELGEATGQIGAPRRRLVGQQLADHAQDLSAPLARRNVALQVIGKKRRTHPVVAARGRECQHRADLHRQRALGAPPGAECAGRAVVHGKENGELTLLQEPLDIGGAEAGGDVPVDGTDVVARLVLAHFGELDAAPAKGARVLPGHDVADEVPGRDLDPPDLGGDLLGVHGTGTAASRRCRRASGPTPSASAR